MNWFEDRQDPANEAIALDHVGHDSAAARLVVDQSHGFFYDHPLDHVPGLLLIEASMQLASRWAWASGRGVQPLTRLSVRFLKYCLHGAPVSLDLRARPDGAATELMIELRQDGTPRARFVLTLGGAVDDGPDARLRKGFGLPVDGPAPRARLGKLNPANVMISAPVPLDGDRFARLLPAGCGNLLADPAGAAHWHPLYLLEAWMQMLRHANTDPARKAERMRDILAGIEFDICAPAPRAAETGLLVEAQTTEQGRWLARRGVIGTEDRVFGRVAMLTARPRRARTETPIPAGAA